MTEAATRPLWLKALLLACAGGVIAGLVGLGNWQMRRLAWKTDLITQVETRADQPTIPLPAGPDALPYQRVTARGSFAHDRAQRVKAVTALGPGFWLMVPLETGARVLWVNRGFVPSRGAPLFQPDGPLTVEGLVRDSEPGGTLLEDNDPAAGRWVSRDIVALSAASGLGNALPYFVDADPMGAPTAWPRGGLTQIKFRNTHLVYALTWYSMAALLAAVLGWIVLGRIRKTPQDTA